jgi:hypothetical protein
MGIIVDFGDRTVEFGHEFQFAVPINDITEAAISFAGSTDYSADLNGAIDRVTGAVHADIVRDLGGKGCGTPGKPACNTWVLSYSLQCKPTQRMF